MQIFALANICRNRINYKLEITGLMGFHATAVDRAIGFLSDRHHRTVSACQNPPYFSTYLTYSSFGTLISHPLSCFLSHLSRVHARVLLFPDEDRPASGCLQRSRPSPAGTATRTITLSSSRPVNVQTWKRCMREDFKCGSRAEGCWSTKQSLATLRSILDIFTINAFNQHDPEQGSIAAVRYF